MAKKPIKKDKQETNIEDQIDNEILNQETVADLKSNNNILKYSIIIIFSLICGGIITLSFSTKISALLPSGMAPLARFLSPSEALAIERIQIYKLETDNRLNKIENIKHPNIDLKIKELRDEISNDIAQISKELTEIDNSKIENRLSELEKKITNTLTLVDELVFNSSKNVIINDSPLNKNYDLIIKKLRSEITFLSNQQNLLIEQFNTLKNANLNTPNNNSKDLNDFDKIKEALNFGGPYKLALEEISKKEIQIPKVLLDNSEGVVTMNYLKTNFPTVAHASLKASLKQTDESGLGGKLLGFLKSQVTVRSLDAQEGNSINAILSRMQVALNNDDLSEAIRQSSDLNGAAKSEIKDWLSLAVKRQETVDAFSEMLGN
ncbi:MAG: mitofilin family membrane protein [Amylibacter sp.]|nr:mitofilin family membrane protein [Amylibacter sp.]